MNARSTKAAIPGGSDVAVSPTMESSPRPEKAKKGQGDHRPVNGTEIEPPDRPGNGCEQG